MELKDQVQGVVLGLFGAYAGAHLADLTAQAEAGNPVALVEGLVNLQPVLLGADLNDDATWVDLILGHMGIASTSAAYDAAADWANGELAAGATRAEVIIAAVTYLLGDTVEAQYADVAAAFQADVAAGIEWSEGDGADVLGIADLRAEAGNVVVFNLTTGADTLFGDSKNNAFTATDLTYTSNDVIADSSTTDSDSLTVNVTAGTSTINATPTVVGIESTTFNFSSFAAPTVDVANIKSGTITVNQNQASGANTANVTNAGAVSVVAGNGVTGTLTVTQADGVSTTVTSQAGVSVAAVNATGTNANTITVTAGKDGAITVGGTASTADAATISGSGTSNLTTNSGAEVEKLTVKGNGEAATFVLQNALGADTTLTAAGTQDVTVSATSLQVNGRTLTDSTDSKNTTLAITATTTGHDLSKVGFDLIDVKTVTADGHDLIFAATGDVVQVSATANRLDLVAGTAGSTATTDSITVQGAGATTLIGNGTAGDGSAADGFETVNYSSVLATGTNTLTATLGTNATLNITGDKAVTLNSASTAKAVNASALTAALTATATANLASIVAGSAADTITIATGATVTVDGGAGYDTVKLTTDVSNATLTNVEALQVTGNITAVKASQLSGKNYVVTTDGSSKTIAVSSIDVTTVDLSGLTLDTTNKGITSITVDAANLDNTKFGSLTALTFIGSSTHDILTGGAGADTINGGAGNDVINGGGGADVLTGGTGDDTFVISGGDLSSSQYLTSLVGVNADRITDFKVSGADVIQLDIKQASATTNDIDETGSFMLVNGANLSGSSTVAATTTTMVSVATAATAGTAYNPTLTGAAIVEFETFTTDGSAADLVAKIVNGAASAAVGASNGWQGFIVSYTAGGDAQLWYKTADAGSNSTLDAAELVLVGTLNNVAANSLVAADFAFI